MGHSNEALAASKREIRDRMRRIRRELPDRPERAARIVGHLTALDVVVAATRLMVYDAVPGEVDLADLVAWATRRGVEVAVPEDGVEAHWPDVIIVPGIAFTARGDRLGQGGGWYDRFLPGRRGDAVALGVCFDAQLVDAVPSEPHDAVVDGVVTENGPTSGLTRIGAES